MGDAVLTSQHLFQFSQFSAREPATLSAAQSVVLALLVLLLISRLWRLLRGRVE